VEFYCISYLIGLYQHLKKASLNVKVDRRIILKMDLQELGCGGTDWIYLA
jgi:hypothetical protein